MHISVISLMMTGDGLSMAIGYTNTRISSSMALPVSEKPISHLPVLISLAVKTLTLAISDSPGYRTKSEWLTPMKAIPSCLTLY